VCDGRWHGLLRGGLQVCVESEGCFLSTGAGLDVLPTVQGVASTLSFKPSLFCAAANSLQAGNAIIATCERVWYVTSLPSFHSVLSYPERLACPHSLTCRAYAQGKALHFGRSIRRGRHVAVKKLVCLQPAWGTAQGKDTIHIAHPMGAYGTRAAHKERGKVERARSREPQRSHTAAGLRHAQKCNS
jgi:hypothetical protein